MTCPACGLKNPDGTLRCDCGRALAAGVVDRVGPPKAQLIIARRWRRHAIITGLLVVAAVAAVAALRWWRAPHDRAGRARAAVDDLCGGAIDLGGDRIGCDWNRSHRPFARASLARRGDGALDQLELWLSGGADDMGAMRARAIAVLDGVLDAHQRDEVRRQLARLVPYDPLWRVAVDGDAMLAATTIDDRAPTERRVHVQVDFGVASLPTPPPDQDGFATIDPAPWQAYCLDDGALAQALGGPLAPGGRWQTGDAWLTCEATSGQRRLSIRTLWDPDTRRVFQIDIDAPDVEALRAIAARVFATTLDDAQRDAVSETLATSSATTAGALLVGVQSVGDDETELTLATSIP
jgi:hypothetical protein